jgi:hypothetical protein
MEGCWSLDAGCRITLESVFLKSSIQYNVPEVFNEIEGHPRGHCEFRNCGAKQSQSMKPSVSYVNTEIASSLMASRNDGFVQSFYEGYFWKTILGPASNILLNFAPELSAKLNEDSKLLAHKCT